MDHFGPAIASPKPLALPRVAVQPQDRLGGSRHHARQSNPVKYAPHRRGYPRLGPMPILNRVADLQPDIMAWRRDLHAHPELLYDVHRPSAFVAERLRAFGCDEVATGLGRTGVVGVIRGRKVAGTDRKSVV